VSESGFYDKSYDSRRLRPGVYIQPEFIARDAPPFRTGVPVFIGTPDSAEARNNGIPVRLTLWSQYSRPLGARPNLLSYAVRGFFENGGQECYVVPVASRTLAAYRSGLEESGKLEAVDLVSVPEYPVKNGNSGTPDRVAFHELQAALMTHCSSLGDRFALLDPLPDQSPEEVIERWANLNSGYAALYYPWIKVPAAPGSAENLIDVPPSPYVAGVYARVDEQVGPGRAPANEIVEGVADTTVALDLETQERLSSQGVNYVQSFRGRGFRLWGARTLSPLAEWRYVNVRRVVIAVVRWIRQNMRDIPFERNGPWLWARIDREITSYLMSLVRNGTLQGSTPEEAFYVRTSAGSNEGEAVTKLGIAPGAPFEFIAVRLIHGDSGVVLSTAEES
jgi:phage tail sheath protein FI